MPEASHKCQHCLLRFELKCPHHTTLPELMSPRQQCSNMGNWWPLDLEGSVLMNELIHPLWTYNFFGRSWGIRKWGLSGGNRSHMWCLPFCFLLGPLQHEFPLCHRAKSSRASSHWPGICEPQNYFLLSDICLGCFVTVMEIPLTHSL